MKKLKILLTIALVLLLGKLFIGVYEHDEFPEKHLFIKHRPIWKTYFYSPRGMSDLELSQMTPEKQKEQKLYDEFVLRIEEE